MAQTAAHRVDHALALPPGRSPGTNSPPDCSCPGSLPRVPVRQWVLSLPIALRLLLAAQPKLVTPVLQVVHRAITRFLLDQAGPKPEQANNGAVTLIQRFGSAATLNIHLHCLVLDGVYRCDTEGEPGARGQVSRFPSPSARLPACPARCASSSLARSTTSPRAATGARRSTATTLTG